jgi:hypothetical protein
MRKSEIQSAQDLSSFVNRVVGVLGEEGDLNEKWAAEGMHAAALFSFIPLRFYYSTKLSYPFKAVFSLSVRSFFLFM